jgi:hypothetical protein
MNSQALQNPQESSSRTAAEAPRSGIVWHASYPKSGNTWTRTFLHNLVHATSGETQAQQTSSAISVTSGAIYIIRNPLDVAVSYAHHLGGTIDEAINLMNTKNAETAVSSSQVYELYGSWSQHVSSWTRKPHRAIFVMRYEDMLAEPQKTFDGLARHLLFTPTPEQLADAIDRSSFDRLREQEEQEGFGERPDVAKRFFREGRAGQWKEVLTPAQIQRIVDAHGEQMQRFGYLPA